MSEADNVRILREAFSALARGDISNFLAYMSDDIELEHLLPREVWPYGGRRRGKTEIAEYLAGLAETYEIDRFEPLRRAMTWRSWESNNIASKQPVVESKTIGS